MRVRLIYPDPFTTNNVTYAPSFAIDFALRTMNRLLAADVYTPGKRMFLVPPLNLMLLAALMPSDIDVEIVDERVTSIDFDDPVDLVGITAMTCDVMRAYQIADEYRSRGVRVIIGGIHATVLPHEAAQHADAVVIGEAEHTITQLIDDHRHGRLQSFYQADRFHDLRNLPHPRRDLLDERYYITRNVLQTTRGCPHRCKFCSISLTAGQKFRCRPISDLIDEIMHADKGFVGFVDDNINGNPRYARELFHALRPLRIRWYADATILIAEDEALLDAAADSGCKVILIGFESLSQNTLTGIHKRFNRPERFLEMIRRIRSRGIGVIGNFILGLDGDGNDGGAQLLQFLEAANLELAQVKILTPYPGTETFDEMDRAGRLLTKRWSEFDTSRGNVVFQPLEMSALDLQNLFFAVNERTYSYAAIFRRLPRMNYRSFFFPYNLRQRKTVLEAKRRRTIPSHVDTILRQGLSL